ncbi:MAG TPA: hypothetical protein PLI98_16225 [Candidatus Hydrogenedentes bacterium]|nr:hypothetical protein [Candidatus Hydrogenedentota bacterium]
MGVVSVLVAVSACFGASDRVTAAVGGVLRNDGRTAVDVQRALNETLALQAFTADGVCVTGNAPEVESLNRDTWNGETAPGAVVGRALRVGGRGPGALKVSVSLSALPPTSAPGTGAWNGYARVAPGAFLKLDTTADARTGTLEFSCPAPGEYVVAAEPPESAPAAAKGLVPSSPDPVGDPALKKDWRLYPVAPEKITGAVPVVLIHGATNDRWAEFTHWAENSPEAATFRRDFSLWNFRHEMFGIDGAMGFDPDCPSYEDSISAHLRRFLEQAETQGVETDSGRHYFPPGRFALLTHSSGAQKAQAFLVNNPDYAERVFVWVTLSPCHTGTPIATMEWDLHTLSRLGLGRANPFFALFRRLLDRNYLTDKRQADLDSGWLNTDRAGGQGIPLRRFTTNEPGGGRKERVLSPRDAARSDARGLPGFEEDTTFVPDPPLETWCGGADLVIPSERGGLYTDRLIIHASYTDGKLRLFDLLRRSNDGVVKGKTVFLENLSLFVCGRFMALFDSVGGGWPMGAYQLNDGFIPMQSQVFLDGRQTAPVFETRTVLGRTLPDTPLRPNLDVIAAHTLAKPENIRIWRNWSHLETVTGRYNVRTGKSAYFTAVAADLSSALAKEVN